jgi:putative addiction module killer protein
VVEAKPLELRRTAEFLQWLRRLRDRSALRVIETRIARLATGNLGDAKALGAGVIELRVDYGPGYRLYLMRTGDVVVILLCGGDKSSQPRDIELARRLAQRAKENSDGTENQALGPGRNDQ